jgi:enoyl-CoA hydratase
MSEEEIVFTRRGNIGHVRLNRPKALNALSLGMCAALLDQLKAWRSDDGVKAVVIRGTGEKAFCAGGDIVKLYEGGRDKGPYPRDFFGTEYTLNTYIKHFPKPYIALIDGIVMGGGVGVSQHGSHRVATERTTLAMPETGIGFFPDVGGTYFLPRLPGKVGIYLGLTGQRIKAGDCLALGVADLLVAAARLDELEEALAAKASANPREVSDIIRTFSESAPIGPVKENITLIDKHFAAPSVEAIVASLKADGGAWATATLDELAKKSPLALKMTFRQLTEGARLSFDAAMQLEWRLATRATSAPNFLEGVRALLIDKDNKPKWEPSTLEAVTDDMIGAFFAPMPGDELNLSAIKEK